VADSDFLADFQAMSSETNYFVSLMLQWLVQSFPSMMRLESIGAQYGVNGFTLTELKISAAKIREVTEGKPSTKAWFCYENKLYLRSWRCFGDQPPRVRRIMEDQQNQDVLFSAEAQMINERSHFTDGQFFILAVQQD